MKTRNKVARLICLATLLAVPVANAENLPGVPLDAVLFPQRCSEDSLEQWEPNETNPSPPLKGTARGRNAWLKKCDPKKYATYFRNGESSEFRGILVANEKGERSIISTRRVYPTYGVDTKESGSFGDFIVVRDSWRAPTEPTESCNVPISNRIVGLCESGCVTPEQQLATAAAYRPIIDLKRSQEKKVLGVSAILDGDVAWKESEVVNYISDDSNAHQDILELQLSNGRTLRTSLNHPLVTFDGSMVQAETLEADDQLMGQDGKAVKVLNIEKKSYFGKLHNLTLNETSQERSIYGLEGVLSGDKKFQNEYVNFLNHKILRETFGSQLL